VKRAFIIASAKGGLGKSTTGRLFVDLARRAGRRVAAWDLDAGTGSMALVYADRDPVVGCGTEDVRNPKARGAWLDSLHGDADDVVLDVPGGAMDDLLRFVDGAGHLVDEMRQAGREVVIVSVIGTQRDSTMTPLVAIEKFGSTVHHVVVKNGHYGDEDQFLVFDGFDDPVTGARRFGLPAKEVRDAGGEVVFVRRLNVDTMQVLDIEGMTFAEGAVGASRIGRRWSSYARNWLQDAEEAFAGTWLSVNGEVGASAASSAKKPKRRDERPAGGEQHLAAV
jgi:hypothetical protein